MARKKTAASRHEDVEEAQGGGQEGHGKITKSEAVRRALADGVDQPADGVAYIRDNFGVEISPTHFSAVKSTEGKKGEAAPKGKPGRKPKAAAPSQAVEGYLAPPPKSRAVDEETDLLAAMEAMKPLVAALGADKVKRIADLLS
jgi:hypothetical protein